MQVNVEAAKIDILRQEIFGRRISGIRKKSVWIDCAPDPNQALDKMRDPAHAKPAHHRARDFVADEIAEYRRMTGMRVYRKPDRFSNLTAFLSIALNYDVL